MGPNSISPHFAATQHLDLMAARWPVASPPTKAPTTATAATGDVEDPEERKLFDQYIAGNFFKQMLSAMRKTLDKPSYFHGGKMEEMIQEKFLDPALAESMAKSSAASFTDPMYELYKRNWG